VGETGEGETGHSRRNRESGGREQVGQSQQDRESESDRVQRRWGREGGEEKALLWMLAVCIIRLRVQAFQLYDTAVRRMDRD